MESVISDGMCRCCATEGNFKDFQVSFLWMGVEEIYGNMLKECFDITLLVSEEVNNGGICEVCITQLRNAYNFKRQVQATEDKFRKIIDERAFKTDEIKMEVTRFDDEDSNNSADDFSSQEYEVPIKEEKVEDKPKKRAARASTSKAKKSKTAVGETSTKRVQPVFTAKVKLDQKVNVSKSEASDTVGGRTKSGEHLTKQLINFREIFLWSNATPIRTNNESGYSCCFCDFVDKKPSGLKAHTKDNHKGIDNACFAKKRDLTSFHVKVDITDLHCTICQQPTETAEVLLGHLKGVHEKRVFTDVQNHLIPFKFETEDLKCYVCSQVFYKFKLLLEHMNKHTRNFVCEVCDAGFVNKKSYRVHQERHKEGNFKCESCPNRFTTVAKLKLHQRTAHRTLKFKNRCRICQELFKEYHQKLLHLRDVHQVEKKIACSACDREFATRKAYRVHIERDHLMKRPHKCDVCEKGFYNSKSLKEHMLKHTGARDFKCDVCLKRYGRKSTLRDHMRIHQDDRRFKCDRCGFAFVQKCSWRGHMRTKHGVEC